MRPRSLLITVLSLVLQAGAFLALTITLGVEAIGDAEVRSASIGVIGFSLVAVIGLALIARALWNLKRWSRGPAIAWSILLVLVGASQFSVNQPIAIAVILLGLVTAGAAVAPATREALDSDSMLTDSDETDSAAS